jgi:hypothetical protein
MIPGKKFNPATETSRRPTPEKFAHLRKWFDVEEKHYGITNITDLQNVDLLLEQFGELYVSNVVHHVIAQLLGAYAGGFVTLQATAAGELKVQLAAGSSDIGSLAAGTNLIGKVEIAGTSRTVLKAKIDFSTIATHSIVALVASKQIKICNIMLTVAGETNLTFKSGTTAISGALDFGGTDEPRGMVHHFGDFPLQTTIGEAFQIQSTAAVQVSGYVTYYTE